MANRLFMGLSFVCALVLSLVSFSPRAAAQDQSYYTYVSFWAVPRTDWAAFEKQERDGISTLQELVANGTLVAWGNTTVRVHTEDGYTHADWIEASSEANLLKALEIEWTSSTNAAFVATTKHHDMLLHTIAHGGKTTSLTTGYLLVFQRQAKHGEELAREAAWLHIVKPFLDTEVQNGTVMMYNFDVQAVHTEPPGLQFTAVAFPDGDAVDRFMADVAANQKQNPDHWEILDSLTATEESREDFSKITAYQHK